MRPIDAVSLSEGIELHRQSTDQEYEVDRQWAVGYNAGLDRALYSIAYAKTVAPPPNDPLTLEELREMGGEPVWCINGNGGQWGLVHVFSAEGETYVECVTKTGFTMDKMTYGTMGIYAWLAYRRKPEEENNGNNPLR